jgi:serine phosphatase RsbU (regulator of sigma subunit)
VGAVLVFRDISEQRQIQKEQDSLTRRYAVENRIGDAMLSGISPDAIQAVATSALGEALGADRCYLSLINAASNRVSVRDDWRKDASLPSLAGDYPLEDFATDLTALCPRDYPLAITDFETDTSLSPTIREYCRRLGVRSAITLGLYGNETLIAAINVAMSEQPRLWTEDEKTLVQSVAALTLTIVESARLRDQEHNIAVRLQEALRPTLPDEMIPGLDIQELYRAALDESSLGGDFFDVFALSDRRYALVVADLAGKGINAASQVAVVRYLLRALLYTFGDVRGGIEKAVTQLNQILVEQNLITGFATLFVSVYSTEDSSLSYVCCGQEPALHYDRENAVTHQLSATGPVVGSFEDATYKEERTQLRSGDAVAIFTDGLTECGPDRGHLLGIEGVIPLWEECLRHGAVSATAADVCECLLAGALKHAEGGLSDDLCLLTIVVKAGT